MSHPEAPPETPEQIRMREFYDGRIVGRGVTIGWSIAKDGSYHSEFARDAWAAWQEAQKATAQENDAHG